MRHSYEESAFVSLMLGSVQLTLLLMSRTIKAVADSILFAASSVGGEE